MGFNTVFYVRNDFLDGITRRPTAFVDYVLDSARSGKSMDPTMSAYHIGGAVSCFGARHNDDARLIFIHHGYPQELDASPIPPNAELAKKRLLLMKQRLAEYENKVKKAYPEAFPKKRSRHG